MPVDKSSLPTKAQQEDLAQKANSSVDNQDSKKDDLVAANDNHDNSSSPSDQVAKEPLQTNTLDGNKKDNTTTPKLEATTNEPTKVSTPPLLDPSSDPAAPKALPSNENNSSQLNAQTTTTPEASTTQNTNSNADKQSTSISTNDHMNSLPTTEHSASKTTDSDDKQATHDSSKSSTIMDPTSNQDANSTNQTNPQIANVDNKQDANQSTHTSQEPNNESSTSRIPESTNDLSKSSKTMVPASNQEPDSVDQSNPLKTDSKTNEATDQSTKTVSTDQQTDEKNPSNETSPKDDRKKLQNLIDQELKIVKKTCPKLKEHGETIKKKAEKVDEEFDKLKIEGDMRELKTLKKTVTKLKLQIPPRYMTYDDSDTQKKHQYDFKSSDNISTTLQRKIPRLHDKAFYDSPICNAIHLRFNALKYELKPCLLCFTVFPENAIISRRSMIYWWIGEGLVPGEDDNAEESANKIFQELMDKDFIEPETKHSRPYVSNCKMNPMVRAALVMIADKVNFFDFDQYGNPKDFGKFDEIESPEDMPGIYPLGEPREFFNFYDAKMKMILRPIEYDDSCQFAAVPREGEPLVNRNGHPIDRSKNYFLYERKELTTKSYKACLMGSGLSKRIPWENLHLLFNVNEVLLQFRPEWFLRMKNINVLFLGNWQSSATHHIEVEDFEFEKSFDSLSNVRFFSLQGVSGISKLPASISKLKSLRILDLRACHNLEEIPETIGLLKCLTHLDMSECYLLRKIPKELSSLESLQVLKGFVVVVELLEKNTCTLQDLTKLEHLRKLSMYTHMKDFPQETHLDALQKLETLRKLTIMWGGHESKEETHKGKEDVGNDKKRTLLASKFKELLSKKKRVQGSMRRMNAFNNSTLGMRLEKLDLKCFPHSKTPNWLTPGNLQGLQKLYIRGGHFSDLGQYQRGDLLPKDTWRIETLRLKYLDELNMEWREFQNLFPKLKYLEKVKCPKLTLFPCNEKGVWMKKGSSNT